MLIFLRKMETAHLVSEISCTIRDNFEVYVNNKINRKENEIEKKKNREKHF